MASTIGQKNPFRYRGYYYDSETGWYYLNSRYYDPEVGRFVNADEYASTGQGIIGYNMFAYCGNNPVCRIDSTGQFWSELWEIGKAAVNEIGNAIVGMTPVYAGCGAVALSDGPLPFADIAAVAGAAIVTAVAVGIGICATVETQTIAIPVPKIEAIPIPKAETKEKSEAIPIPQPSKRVYYHSTTLESAEKIIATGIMYGSSWEGGYVYAFRTRPNRYAVNNSGAHLGVIIVFETDALFIEDTGITDPSVLMYDPVVSVMPGPIFVDNVFIVG